MSKDLDILQGLGSTQDLHVPTTVDRNTASAWHPNFEEYSRICVAHSGGKDSMACLLHLIDLGAPLSKIELHHHCVDGEGEESELMDWPCTHSFMEAIAKAFNIPIYFSWREGGFKRELLRENCGTAPVVFTKGNGERVRIGGERSKNSTRRKFPQQSANMMVRWCSGVLKGDVSSRQLVNDERFTVGKTLFVTGERAEESPNRAKYATFEPHRNDNRNGRVPRWIDHWRPVHAWTEAEVWDIHRRKKVAVHPAYFTGTGRASCMLCVFASSNQWATVREIAPVHFHRVANYEKEFGVTIHRTRSVIEQADRGKAYASSTYWRNVAMSRHYTLPIFVDEWELPLGAFGESCGPT